MRTENYNRRDFLKTAGVITTGAMLAPGCLTIGRQKQPNILCITCEDISSYLGCFGDPIAITPNLDQLAAEGIRFTNFFSTVGVCAPSRFALITGMYPSACGANNMRTNSYLPEGIPPYEAVPPPGVRCFSEYMRANGYYCTNNSKTDYQFESPVTAWDESSTKATWKNRPRDMPFFAIFNLMTTHESQVWDRANDPVTIRPEDVPVPPYFPDTPNIRRDIARVYSNITIMDREVGEIIAEVKRAGLLDDTVIIFYSDHGGPLPRGKREIYDSGLKAPMIIRFPDKRYAGKIVDDLISFIDIPPTIMSLAGIEPPSYMHGRAFLGQDRAQPREYIFGARDRMDSAYDVRRAVRDKKYKYIRNYRPDIGAYQNIEYRNNLASMRDLLEWRDEGKLNEEQMYWFRETKEPEELYDLDNDPYELHNLAGDPHYENDLLRLRQVLEDWLMEVGDNPMQTEKELVWSMWPGGVQPVTAEPIISKQGGRVDIRCATPGASIAYQINGEGYNKDHWYLYSKPLRVKKGNTLTAAAIRIGYKQSESVSLVF